jgi:hypothetical protein
MGNNKSIGLCSMQKCGEQQELLDWLTAELIANFLLDNTAAMGASFVIGDETGGDTRLVTVQMTQAGGAVNQAGEWSVWMWLSDTSGGPVTADAPSGGTTATVGTILQEHATDVSLDILTAATGQFILSIVEAADDTWYLNVRMPSGEVFISAAITFAA